MCASCNEKAKKSVFFNFNFILFIAAFCGTLAGFLDISFLNQTANIISEIFINLLKLVSLPIIFLSIVSTAARMEGVQEIRKLGFKVGKYTLATTVIAACIALLLFVVIDPVNSQVGIEATGTPDIAHQVKKMNFIDFLVNTIPSNILKPFVEGSVIGVLILAMGLSFAIITLPDENRKVLHGVFSSLYQAVMKVTTWIITLMPLAIFGFVTLFVHDLREGLEASSIALYLACVILANLIQAIIVLPAFLKAKGIPVRKVFKGMLPALSVAFFSKSSSGSLPMTMKCAEENVGVSRKVSSFTLPLCTTINMNGCAAFILTTVLFVSMSNGVVFTGAEMVGWVFIATIAAVGNAGVPMGCYFMSSAFLAGMGVPLNIMGVILPFYTLIDMLETTINVWSDSCVAVIVQKEVDELELATEAVPVPIEI